MEIKVPMVLLVTVTLSDQSGGEHGGPYDALGSGDIDCPDDPYRTGSDSSSSSEFGRCRHD